HWTWVAVPAGIARAGQQLDRSDVHVGGTIDYVGLVDVTTREHFLGYAWGTLLTRCGAGRGDQQDKCDNDSNTARARHRVPPSAEPERSASAVVSACGGPIRFACSGEGQDHGPLTERRVHHSASAMNNEFDLGILSWLEL